jgi:anthranilate/para-aminobenzoate synthase component I
VAGLEEAVQLTTSPSASGTGALRERIHGWVDPGVAFIELFGSEQHAFWLDAGADASEGTTRMGAAAAGPSVRFATAHPAGRPESLTRFDPRTGRVRAEQGSLFDVLRRERVAAPTEVAGWVGWFGYEFGAAACGAPIAERGPQEPPDAAWMRFDRFVEFDHAARSITVCVAPGSEAAAADAAGTDAESRGWVAAVVTTLGRLIRTQPGVREHAARPQPAGTFEQRKVNWRHSEEQYLDLIRQVQRHISAGDAYQLCLTNAATIEARLEPLDTYLRLRAASPTANGGYVRFGDWALASASPEQFLTVSTDGLISTRPIKGTRPRGALPADDERLRAELAGDEKERAENLMIVDLMRNDLGRVARLGTVAVTGLLEVESYRQVHQLVSTVTARLDDGADALDAVAACFPAGSMTGAPKLAAMSILHRLEGGPRGPYAGSFGLIADDGSLRLSMIIRSILIGPDIVSLGAGGGITAMSAPRSEVAEVALKARALLAAVNRAAERRPSIL